MMCNFLPTYFKKYLKIKYYPKINERTQPIHNLSKRI